MIVNVIDSHAHLNEIGDLPSVLKRATEAGITSVVAVSVNPATSLRILEIARSFQSPIILPAIGLYPDEVTEDGIEKIAELIDERHQELAAVGEIGLDYWIKPLRKKQPNREEKKQLQRKAFRRQLELAKTFSLVPIIHSRGAWADCARLVADVKMDRSVFHWYSGPLEVLEFILENGYHISATPAAAASPPHRASLKMAPLEKIILETDCPVPRKEGEQRILTEPADVLRTLKAVAELKGIPEEQVAATTTATARELFGIRN